MPSALIRKLVVWELTFRCRDVLSSEHLIDLGACFVYGGLPNSVIPHRHIVWGNFLRTNLFSLLTMHILPSLDIGPST